MTAIDFAERMRRRRRAGWQYEIQDRARAKRARKAAVWVANEVRTSAGRRLRGLFGVHARGLAASMPVVYASPLVSFLKPPTMTVHLVDVSKL